MPVTSVKELARSADAELLQPTVLKRRWVCVLADNTLTNAPSTEDQILAAVGIGNWGAPHPLRPYFALRKWSIREGFEGSPYHVEVTAEYSPIRVSDLLDPWDRPAEWTAEGSQGEFPALFHFEGAGNYDLRPLTNSAYDYFPGLTTTESVARITVRQNFANWPSAWFAANNTVNSAPYFGCPTHTLRVAGVTAEYAQEERSTGIVGFYRATATLAYRWSGHNLQLPDVGFNFISGGQKRRAMVFDFQNSEWVPSPNPVGLDGNGGQTQGQPAVLNRRVNPEVEFRYIFGVPPA
jgi:hypothetical protein